MQLKKARKYILFFNLLLVLALFHYSIWKKEAVLDKGRLVLMQLAPVDPRSLMQGDYMELRYNLDGNIDIRTLPKRGYCVITLNDSNIARVIRFQAEAKPLQPHEHLVKYFKASHNNIRIGAESYFFEEGKGDRYSKARYGALRVDEQGSSVLFGLYDSSARLIKK